MTQAISALFDSLWQQYVEVTPSAAAIQQLLAEDGKLTNDHIALRTFDLDRVALDRLAAHFRALGYQDCGEYQFEAKQLHAKHFEHADASLPKVFISELKTAAFSPWLQATVAGLIAKLSAEQVASPEILSAGRCWPLSFATYRKLQQESEYAAWLAAWGFRANHFTVSINHLAGYSSIQAVNARLEQAGFTLNSSGGKIKGTPDTLLEQSSTMADQAEMVFSDGLHTIPSCFYEFALRYPQPDGKLFNDFVPASADKIFESTDNLPS